MAYTIKQSVCNPLLGLHSWITIYPRRRLMGALDLRGAAC